MGLRDQPADTQFVTFAVLATYDISTLAVVSYLFTSSGGVALGTKYATAPNVLANTIVPEYPSWRVVTIDMSGLLAVPTAGTQMGGVGLVSVCASTVAEFVAYGNSSSSVSLTATDGLAQGT
jgi:hypothetical protein